MPDYDKNNHSCIHSYLIGHREEKSQLMDGKEDQWVFLRYFSVVCALFEAFSRLLLASLDFIDRLLLELFD